MVENKIIIKGAREHNLKNINIEIPRNKLVVITGLSGSGKSSLAFDTIYAEGQRRYVESLSAYARQFLGQMQKPDVDQIIGLSPAVAIQQKGLSRNPRSTVGTLTEIYDYLRLLFARIGHPHCPKCGREILPQTSQQIVEQVLSLPEGSKIQILSPLVRGRKGVYRELFDRIRQDGYVRAKVDGKTYGLEEEIRLDKNKKHNIEVVVDRLVIRPEVKTRLTDSIETALKLAQGTVLIDVPGERSTLFSAHNACPHCGISIGEISPRSFSFNSPYGACSSCSGLGTKTEIDPDLVVPDKDLSVNEGALVPWSNPITTRRHRWKWAARSYYYDMLEDVSDYYGFSLDTPFKKLPDKYQNTLLYGSPDEIYESGEPFEGVITQLERRYHQTESDFVREEIFNKYMTTRVCPECQGKRLKKESLAVTVQGKSIADMAALSVKEAQEFFNKISLSPTEALIAGEVIKEIKKRLSFLINVGLDYITIDRPAATLAGGEAERIHLATQIGSSLVGVIYILDEPTIGLHPRDVSRLISTLEELRDLANTVIVVEHDLATILAADHIIDLGPGAGEKGGRVVVSGPLSEIVGNPQSLTGAYISGKLKVPLPLKRRKIDFSKALEIKGAAQFNLKNIDVKIPLGFFVCITGVSGSGKSTLIQEILYKALAQKIYHSKEKAGRHKEILGVENIDKIINIDQSPIGRTPRSNPATYTDLFTPIRMLFAQLPEAKIRGYKPGRFSFNVKGGRCEACMGDGLIRIEMQFLPDVYVPCEVCKEKRFNQETLEVRYKGKNIADVLSMSVEEALEFFKNIPRVREKLQTLSDVGLDYVKLGQSATTLSGGEAQRVKLAKELSKRSTGGTLYLLDEPTTGLHFADIEKLLNVLHRLVDRGNTVLVIEHNLDVIKTADYIIDLGPEGGERGGEVIAAGSPEELCQSKKSYTGIYLRKFLK